MVLKLKNFGEVFSSRTDGREAALATIAYQFKKDKIPQQVQLDFSGVLIMTPSWLSEFIQTLQQHGVQKVSYQPASNLSVLASIEAVEQEFKFFGKT